MAALRISCTNNILSPKNYDKSFQLCFRKNCQEINFDTLCLNCASRLPCLDQDFQEVEKK